MAYIHILFCLRFLTDFCLHLPQDTFINVFLFWIPGICSITIIAQTKQKKGETFRLVVINYSFLWKHNPLLNRYKKKIQILFWMVKSINFFANVKERCFYMIFYIKSKRVLTNLPHLLLPRQSGTHWPGASAADTQQHTAHTESSTQEEVQG